MLTVEDWAEIRRLHRAEGMPIKMIARVLGVSRNTVKAALRRDGPPRYERPCGGRSSDEVEPRIRELLQAFPTMPATVIAERIGWTRSIRVLRDRVAELRPVYLPPDPASRTSYAAGRDRPVRPVVPADQPAGRLRPDRTADAAAGADDGLRLLPLAAAVLIPSRTAEDLFAGWWQLLAGAGGGAAGAGLGRRGRGRPLAGRAQRADRRLPGASAAPWARRCWSAGRPIRRPRAWSSGCTTTWRRSFLPGRTFTGPADFNAQLRSLAGAGEHPPPAGVGLRTDRSDHRRSGGDAHPAAGRAGHRLARRRPAAARSLRALDGNDYSVHPAVIGRRVEVLADLDRVRVLCDGRLVADHERVWAKHQTISDRPSMSRPRRRCAAERLGACGRTRSRTSRSAALADYDTALGLSGDSDGGVA